MVFSGSLAHPLSSQPPVPVPSRLRALWRASGTFQSSHDPRGCRGRGGPLAVPFQHLRFARISSQPLVTRVTLERKKELINGFKVVCLQ